MLSKYELSAKSALDIESVVGELMEELGVGGFMGVQDVKSGMKISLVLNTDISGGKEYTGEVVECKNNDIFVTLDKDVRIVQDDVGKPQLCRLQIVVENVLYCWKDIAVRNSKPAEKGQTGEATWLTARNYEGAALDADNAKYINTLIRSF